MRLLLVEDTPRLARSIAQGLTEEGFSVDVVGDGGEGLFMACEIPYDLIILDRMLPTLDGLTVLKRAREQGVATPVLLLTALGEVHHRVEGLGQGADDYLVKPFAFDELLARIRALLRRSHGHAQNRIALDRLVIDVDARTASVDGKPVELSAKELALLELLALAPGKTYSRTQLSQRLYHEDADPDSNVIDVFIARLRKKFDAAGLVGAKLIETRRGEGYRLEPLAAREKA